MGNIYGVNDEGAPRPPQHYNCRSTIVPIVMGYEDIGDRLKKQGVPKATRASINGQVPATTDFGNWLGNQSHIVQNTVLGQANAEVFRSGKISLKQILGRLGQSLSVGSARRIDAKIADSENPRILVREGNTDVNEFDINEDVSTKKRFTNKSNRDAIVQYIGAQGGSGGKPRSFGRINEKSQKSRGGDFLDEETGTYYVDDRISYDAQVYKQLLDDEKVAVQKGALTRQDIEFLDDMERRLSPLLESNQITAARRALRVVLTRFNGKKGSGARYVDIETLILDNPNAFIKRQLDLSSGETLGRLSKNSRTARNRTSVQDLYGNVQSRNRAVKRFEERLTPLATSERVVTRLENTLRELDILIDRPLGELSQDIVDLVASRLFKGATPTALEIGKIVGAPVGTRVNAGYRIIEALFEETGHFRVVTTERRVRSATVIDNKKNPNNGSEANKNRSKREDYREIQPSSDAWIVYARNVEDVRVYESLPQTTGKGNAIIRTGDTVGPDGKPYISNKAGNDRNDSLSQTDAESLTIQNQQQYRVNQEVVLAYRIYREEFSNDLGGNYSKNGQVTVDWERVIEAYEYQGGRRIIFFHHPDNRHRKYSRGDILDPQGNEWNRGALRFETNRVIEETFERDFDAEFAQLLGPQKVNGLTRHPNTIRNLEIIAKKYKPQLLKLGNAILDGDKVAIRKYLKFAATSKEPAGIINLAEVWAKYERSGRSSRFKTDWRPHKDGTGNVVQIAAAITRDARLAKASNLRGGNRKRSPYTDVEDVVFNSKFVREHPVLKKLTLEEFEGIAKQPTMTSVYNITQKGVSDQLVDFLGDALGETGRTKSIWYKLSQRGISSQDITKLAQLTTRAVAQEFPKLDRLTRFLNDYARKSGSTSGRVRWNRPIHGDEIDYTVRQRRRRTVNYTYGGKRVEEKVWEYTDDIDIDKTTLGFPANFIHSIDSSIVDNRHINKPKDSGLQTTHDSFSPDVSNINITVTGIKDDIIAISRQNPLRALLDDGLKAGDITQGQYNDLLRRLEIDRLDPDLGDWQLLEEIYDSFWAFS